MYSVCVPAAGCAHPVPHLVECLAMLYMLLAVPGSRAAGQGAGMHMAGLGASTGAAGSFPALAVVLAIFMIGYLAWAADQLTSLASGRTVRTPRTAPDPASRPATRHSASTVMVAEAAYLTASAEGARAAHPAGRPMLAPRLSACTKIAISLGMGYMLILMLLPAAADSPLNNMSLDNRLHELARPSPNPG